MESGKSRCMFPACSHDCESIEPGFISTTGRKVYSCRGILVLSVLPSQDSPSLAVPAERRSGTTLARHALLTTARRGLSGAVVDVVLTGEIELGFHASQGL